MTFMVSFHFPVTFTWSVTGPVTSDIIIVTTKHVTGRKKLRKRTRHRV